VRVASLGLTAANFWSDGPSTAGIITVDRMACVLLQAKGDSLEVAVSDPTQSNTATIAVELSAPGLKLIGADPEVHVDRLSPTIRLSFLVADASGRTFHARFLTRVP